MGRLTLNVLLSFAQFEREVIGERIRDKIAASKKKGMWMGGVPPLFGYGARDHKLVMIDGESGTRSLDFPPLCRTRFCPLVEGEAEARGSKVSRRRAPPGASSAASPFSRGALYLMLQNHTYLGKIVHRGRFNHGEHTIIDQPLWFAGSRRRNAAQRQCGGRTRQPSLLAGMLFDGDGDRHNAERSAEQDGTRYRYYVSGSLITKVRTETSAGLESSRRDRAARQRPSAPMAPRSRQHLQIDSGRLVNSSVQQRLLRAGRRHRQALARVARRRQACGPSLPDRTDRGKGRPD